MILKKKIVQKAVTDPDLFADLCKVLGRTVSGTYQCITRNKGADLKSVAVLKTIEKHTGLKEDQIFQTPISELINQ